MISSVSQHRPVLLKETISLLNIKPNQAYIDCTIGSAGHAVEIIKKGGKLYGLDVDPAALKRAEKCLKVVCPDAFFCLEKGNFANLKSIANKLGLTSAAGILIDLGLSSDQLADENRGFSFQLDAPLDMRFDSELKVTAADLVNGLHQGELKQLFTEFGEERYSSAIAKRIVQARQQKKISSTLELVEIVKQVVPWRKAGIHPATKVFQALRIAVNDELNSLKTVLPQAVSLLKPQGRLVIISFHSLEDRIVKKFIRNNKNLVSLMPKPITPSTTEVKLNSRSRSAKLRAAEKK